MPAIELSAANGSVGIVRSVRECPVCDGRRVQPLHSMRFFLPDDHPLTDGYDVVACVTCGGVYADTPSSQADYDRYYADSSRYSDPRTGTGAGVQAWDDARLETTARVVADFLPDRTTRVVDIGCANGGLLRWFARLGFDDLLGVDPSPACVAAAAEIPGVEARRGTIFGLPVAPASVGCVMLSHVLEHVRDVGAAVAGIRNIVSTNGTAYVEVPDATRYAECLAAAFQDFNVEHINHFSPTSLANVLRRGGFEVEHVGQKTIEASPGVPYPAVWAIARAAVPQSTPVVERDDALAWCIRDYVDRSAEAIAAYDAFLDRALADVPEIVVWGTGQTTLTLLSSTRVGGARVVAFTDSNPLYHGRRLAGRPVLPPEDVATIDAPILVGSIIHRRAITDRIRELGLPNPVVTLDVARQPLQA